MDHGLTSTQQSARLIMAALCAASAPSPLTPRQCLERAAQTSDTRRAQLLALIPGRHCARSGAAQLAR